MTVEQREYYLTEGIHMDHPTEEPKKQDNDKKDERRKARQWAAVEAAYVLSMRSR